MKYVGTAAVRTITSAQWRQLGIELKDPKAGHVWSAANDYLVESAQFSDEQLDYLLIDDAGGANRQHDFIEVTVDVVDGNLVQTVR